MKNHTYRNTLLLFVIVLAILLAVLVVVIGIPFSFALVIKLMLGCSMIAMSYYYVVSRNNKP